MATIYRVLRQLTDAVGSLERHVFGAESRRRVYEVQQGRHLDHLIGLQCGLVSVLVDETIMDLSRARAASKGYSLSAAPTLAVRLCAKCRAGMASLSA